MPDHDVLFRQLRSKIVASVTPHVVQLQSETCSTGEASNSCKLQQILNFAGMKAVWKEILLQLTRTSETEVRECNFLRMRIYTSHDVCLRMRKLH